MMSPVVVQECFLSAYFCFMLLHRCRIYKIPILGKRSVFFQSSDIAEESPSFHCLHRDLPGKLPGCGVFRDTKTC